MDEAVSITAALCKKAMGGSGSGGLPWMLRNRSANITQVTGVMEPTSGERHLCQGGAMVAGLWVR